MRRPRFTGWKRCTLGVALALASGLAQAQPDLRGVLRGTGGPELTPDRFAAQGRERAAVAFERAELPRACRRAPRIAQAVIWA